MTTRPSACRAKIGVGRVSCLPSLVSATASVSLISTVAPTTRPSASHAKIDVGRITSLPSLASATTSVGLTPTVARTTTTFVVVVVDKVSNNLKLYCLFNNVLFKLVRKFNKVPQNL